MPIKEGDRLPGATLFRLGEDGPETVSLGDRLEGRKVVIFAVPGAFTPTCTSSHMPSFVRTKPQLDEKGVDEIICIAVNDPFVLKAWGAATGADEAGITLLADPEAAFTNAIGMEFTVPATGLISRSQRYAMLVEDGVVRVFNPEPTRGTSETSSGEAMLEAL